ncbi:hypothetical protein EVAR_65384_1 [Eumeta japonica]|uniref:Uncharacterized protein n=1 Tax=Eumeta variegata TaxID=151549 RepID=A0A4C1ZUP7_EUMVA|nr:hypothetical protein EVAR_65384_1 [Eumeta japonica]
MPALKVIRLGGGRHGGRTTNVGVDSKKIGYDTEIDRQADNRQTRDLLCEGPEFSSDRRGKQSAPDGAARERRRRVYASLYLHGALHRVPGLAQLVNYIDMTHKNQNSKLDHE